MHSQHFDESESTLHKTIHRRLFTFRIAMSTFSATSPRITEDEECRERESLTPEEIDEIEQDIKGTGFDVVETDGMKLQAVVQLDEAIDAIPGADKVDYLRALELCPELVRTESGSIRFLRSENYNPWDAARRLVKFWAVRRKIFGENAFLPLTLTGHGALSRGAIQMMNSGYWFGIPDDSKDRTVVYFDRSRNQNSPRFRNAMLQVMVYTFMILLEEREFAQTNGFVLLVNGASAKIAGFDRKLARDSIALLRECLPIRLRGIHVCVPFRHPPFNFVLPVVKFILGKYLRRRLLVHHGSDLEVLLGLESHGMIRANIPPALGGHYPLQSELAEWLLGRLELDGQREVNA